MYRFAARPRWIAAHLVVIALAIALVNLGLWQMRRLHAQRDRDSYVARRLRMPPAPLAAAGAYRRIETTGTFDTHGETILFGRALEGRPGHHVLTWLDTERDGALLVDRGWVPFEYDTAPVRAAAPRAGLVRVEGILVPSQHGGTQAQGRTTAVDVVRLAKARGVDAVPYYLVLARQDPPQLGELPVRVPVPGVGGAPPHLSYAIQWFSFATIGIVGYAFVLRRTGRA
jgi:surfeit locus 1 family protein